MQIKMKVDLHYTDPGLVALYDLLNPRGIDTDFYIQLAADIKAKIIFDLGCGTGLLTRELVQNDRQVSWSSYSHCFRQENYSVVRQSG